MIRTRALGTDGTVTCWCIDESYESSICGSEPAGDAFVEVQSGGAWACAEDSNAELHCWGERRSTRDAPTGPVLDWAIETHIGCAVLPDSTVRCWGNTELFSQYGETEPPPLLAPPADLKYTQVAVGRSHACALDTDGEVHCWGSTGLQVPYPAAPPGPFASIVAWSQITCGLRPDGAAECWYDFPQLEDVDDVPPEADGGPPWEPPPGKKWAQIGLGEWDACGLTLDGEAHCWMPQMDTLGEVLELPSLSSL